MTYQQKFDELQKLFSEKFDAYEKMHKGLSLENDESAEYETARFEFEKVSFEFQTFLIMFKDNNASSNDEFGAIGERCHEVTDTT